MDIQPFFDFVRESPSAFHASDALCRRLEAAGFLPLSERGVCRLFILKRFEARSRRRKRFLFRLVFGYRKRFDRPAERRRANRRRLRAPRFAYFD